MITKENLLGMLQKSLINEGEFMAQYGGDLLNRIDSEQGLNQDEKKEITSLLSGLLEDTARHEKTVERLIEDLKKDGRDEF